MVVLSSDRWSKKGQPRPRAARGLSLAALASRQHGVVSIRQLETRLGYSRRRCRRRWLRGGCIRCSAGSMRWGIRICRRGDVGGGVGGGAGVAAELLVGGVVAGVLHSSLATIHVTATGPRRLRARAPVRVHRARNLGDADRALEEGIPVTSVARTLLDLAERTRAERLPKLLERAEDPKMLDVYAVYDCLRPQPRPQRREAAPSRGVLYRPTARVLRSDVERDFLALVRVRRLPLPSTNFVIAGDELDAYWPDHGLAVELDTYATHGTPRLLRGRPRTRRRARRGRDHHDPGHRPPAWSGTRGAVARRLELLLRPGGVPRRRAWRTSRV